MPSCPSCGADRISPAPNAPCARCGATVASSPAPIAAPELELDIPKRVPPRPVRQETAVETPIELAVEPRSFVRDEGNRGLSSLADDASPSPARPGAKVGPLPAPIERVGTVPEAALDVADVAFDASLLADYGDPPANWLLAPFYAWRVLKRKRELKTALAGRRDEANRARHEVDEALVALSERVRATIEKQPEFAQGIEELRGAEDVLRSRDRVLAAEQDAQTARLASVDARLAKLEADVSQALAEERAIAAELTSAQAALARGDAKLKRAESELRAAIQRETDEMRA